MKGKYERLSNMKKPAVDFNCRPDVRRAKHIAWAICARAANESLGDGGIGVDVNDDERIGDGSHNVSIQSEKAKIEDHPAGLV